MRNVTKCSQKYEYSQCNFDLSSLYNIQYTYYYIYIYIKYYIHIPYLILLYYNIILYLQNTQKIRYTRYIQSLAASSGKYRSKYPDRYDFRNKFSGNQYILRQIES